ncbi:MAG: hypothetical protein KIT80_01735 [Chitinophagaceae bacterium]|nr:hypothetical protein [Chitinophagaceae bacterium]MCW5925607.1 hypothetical protein [Chitinophagaceae bacterium]
MKSFKFTPLFIFLHILLLLTLSCSAKEAKPLSNDDIVLVASTPCDELIKKQLSITTNDIVDFMKWVLVLKADGNFSLDIHYGESKPNTMGFKKDHSVSCEGIYSITITDNAATYTLKSKQFLMPVRLLKLNENTFHLLTPDNKLIVGNGGWSYMLNRKNIVKEAKEDLPDLSAFQSSLDSPLQVAYDGRTPCEELSMQHNFNLPSSHFKLKWRLILNRDSVTRKPTTSALGTVLNSRQVFVYGKWTIEKEATENGQATFLKLVADATGKITWFLVGDENVLFFLNDEKRLFTGNADFSYALNRK